jgi:hypothetical protein
MLERQKGGETTSLTNPNEERHETGEIASTGRDCPSGS